MESSMKPVVDVQRKTAKRSPGNVSPVGIPVARPVLTAAIIIALATLVTPVFADPNAASTFNQRCAGCHTYGKGIRVGPDLKGVTDRRPRSWLLRFIRSSESVIRSGDPVAQALYQTFHQQKMPDHDLSPQQIEDLLDYFEQGGPGRRAADERDASTATLADVEVGRRLFAGEVRLTSGSQACSSCHRAGDTTWIQGGSLGPNLSRTYWEYKDKTITSLLRHPCFPREPEIAHSDYLTPQESFELKAYLRQVSLSQPKVRRPVNREETDKNASLKSNEQGIP
jgi:mono/diheme cytochrome c family protein